MQLYVYLNRKGWWIRIGKRDLHVILCLETLESSDSVPEGPSTLGGGGGTSPGSTLPNLGRRTENIIDT